MNVDLQILQTGQIVRLVIRITVEDYYSRAVMA